MSMTNVPVHVPPQAPPFPPPHQGAVAGVSSCSIPKRFRTLASLVLACALPDPAPSTMLRKRGREDRQTRQGCERSELNSEQDVGEGAVMYFGGGKRRMGVSNDCVTA